MKPIQYQKGYVEFYKLKFKVTPDTLIPRPETELLVDEVLKCIHNKLQTNNSPTVLDIGTGAGSIAISVAKNLPTPDVGIQIIATDISPKALKVARMNAKLHEVEDKIKFIQSDLLSAFCHSESRYNRDSESPTNVGSAYAGDPSLITQDDNLIIVTNLPYIPSARIPYLDSSVKDFEPHVALDGGKDGFQLYRKLFQQIKDRDWKVSLLIGEIDYTHGELAFNEAYKYFPKAQIEVKKDLSYKQRILTVRL